MMTLPYGSTSCVRFQGSGTNPLSALTGSPSSDDYSERPLFCKEPFSSFFPLLFDDQQILKRTLRHMVHALRVAPVLHGAVSPHGFNAADFLLEAERQYEQRLKVLGDAQHLADLARIKGQENAAAEVPRIRRQLDGLRGDARINGIQFCPRPRLTENGDVTGGTLTRFGAVPIGQHPRPFQRRENGGASFRGFRNGKPQRLRVSTSRRHAGTRNKPVQHSGGHPLGFPETAAGPGPGYKLKKIHKHLLG